MVDYGFEGRTDYINLLSKWLLKWWNEEISIIEGELMESDEKLMIWWESEEILELKFWDVWKINLKVMYMNVEEI